MAVKDFFFNNYHTKVIQVKIKCRFVVKYSISFRCKIVSFRGEIAGHFAWWKSTITRDNFITLTVLP